jgi:hypothetical protein
MTLSCAFAVAACSDPCVELARKVCRCERSETEQQACIQRIDSVEERTSEKDRDCCALLLDRCNCNKLADGDLAACGIAQEADDPNAGECVVPESESPQPGNSS